MNIDIIEQLARILNAENLGVLEVEEGELRIRLEGARAPVEPAMAFHPAAMPAPQPDTLPAVAETHVDFNIAQSITSPMVGVYYQAPSPDAEPYVKVGSRFKKGDVLCIVEAMKLMNEIIAEQDGEIVDICVANGDVVEFGQTLFQFC